MGEALDISETDQRVVLHHARSKVRRALEGYLTEERIPPEGRDELLRVFRALKEEA